MDDGLLEALEASILSAELQPKWRRAPTLGESDFAFSQLALLSMWMCSVGKELNLIKSCRRLLLETDGLSVGLPSLRLVVVTLLDG